MTRNPLIFGLFTRMHLVERIASGILRMKEDMKMAKLPEPEFHTDGIFTVVFRRNYRIKNDTVNDTVNKIEHAIYKLIRKNPGMNAAKIARQMGKSIPTIKRYLSSLYRLNMIEL